MINVISFGNVWNQFSVDKIFFLRILDYWNFDNEWVSITTRNSSAKLCLNYFEIQYMLYCYMKITNLFYYLI
jgi:hypothetical protein